MTKEKYKAIYTGWPDEQLLTEFAKKEDYETPAMEAMEEVLAERGLMAQFLENERLRLEKQSKSLKGLAQAAAKSEAIRLQEKENQRVQTLTKNAEMEHSGSYLDASIMNALKNVFTTLALGSGLAGVIGVIIYAVVEKPAGSGFIFFTVLTIILVVFGSWNLKASLGRIKINKTGPKKLSVEIIQGKHRFDIQSPLDCRFYAFKTQQRVNGIKAGSYFTLVLQFKTADGITIALHENQGALGRLPDDWQWVSWNDPVLKGDYVFDYLGRRKMKMNEIKLLMNPYLKNG